MNDLWEDAVDSLYSSSQRLLPPPVLPVILSYNKKYTFGLRPVPGTGISKVFVTRKIKLSFVIYNKVLSTIYQFMLTRGIWENP